MGAKHYRRDPEYFFFNVIVKNSETRPSGSDHVNSPSILNAS